MEHQQDDGGNNDTIMMIIDKIGAREQEQGNKRHLEEQESSGDHEWSELYDYHDRGHNGKQRECRKCGMVQKYGHVWGSRKKGAFENVEILCPGVISKKVHQVHKDDGEHAFGVRYSVHVGGTSHYERKCQNCGMKQKYGVRYGSKRTPGYESVDPKCGDTLHI
jgi:hypothetical protein